MKYALLIYTDERVESDRNEAEQQANMAAYFAFTEELRGQGKMLGGDALLPTHMAKSVQVRDGQTLTVDGPFAETKEQLGGFYLIEADSEADAVAWAAKIPGAQHGTIEIRPLMVFE